VFGPHPDVHHDPGVLGCSVCHAGDPQGLHAHQHARYGVAPPLSGAEAWAACLRCHSPLNELPVFGAYRAAGAAQQQVEDALVSNGCLGCHKVVERGGSQGTALAGLGGRRMGDPHGPFPSTHAAYTGRLEVLAGVAPGSTMPQPTLTGEQRRLLAAFLVLNTPLPALAERRWLPARRLTEGDSSRAWGAFCSGCHGADGQGRERGRQPGAVPTLGSSLFASFADRGLLAATVDSGRPGTLMEGFGPAAPSATIGAWSSSERRGVLPRATRQSLVELIATARLAPPDRPREALARAAMAASCSQCHLRRAELYEGLGPSERALLFAVHPFSFGEQALLRSEGLTPLPPERARERGAELFRTICRHCHADTQPRPVGAGEPSAPLLRAAVHTPGFSAGFFLANLVVGRGDAPPTRWRHEGLRSKELGVVELLAVLGYLRSAHDTPAAEGQRQSTRPGDPPPSTREVP